MLGLPGTSFGDDPLQVAELGDADIFALEHHMSKAPQPVAQEYTRGVISDRLVEILEQRLEEAVNKRRVSLLDLDVFVR